MFEEVEALSFAMKKKVVLLVCTSDMQDMLCGEDNGEVRATDEAVDSGEVGVTIEDGDDIDVGDDWARNQSK